MRIVGGTDYYDYGLSFGVDTETVFVRTGRVIAVPANQTAIPHPATAVPGIEYRAKARQLNHSPYWTRANYPEWQYESFKYILEGVCALFCDSFHSGVRVFWEAAGPSWELENSGGKPARRGYAKGRQETFWDRNSLAKFLAKRGAVLKPTRRTLLTQQVQVFVHRKQTALEREFMLSNGLAVATHTPQDTVDLLISGHRHTRPAWNCNNDTLKDLDFVKVLDPVQAFQELSMWVGGVLPKPGNPTVQITDDRVKLAKHGMDKWSFRKMSEKTK